MPQNAIATLDVSEGVNTLINITAPVVVKAAPGRVARMFVISPGTAGALVLNDTTALPSAAAANEIFYVPYNATNMYAGNTVMNQAPMKSGITISQVPAGFQGTLVFN